MNLFNIFDSFVVASNKKQKRVYESSLLTSTVSCNVFATRTPSTSTLHESVLHCAYAQTVSHMLTISCKCISRLTICTFADFFFKILFRKKNLSWIPSKCQLVWIQVRPDVLSGLIWIQTVWKGYQQTIKVATSRQRLRVKRVNTIGIVHECLQAAFLVLFILLLKNNSTGSIRYFVWIRCLKFQC